MLPVIPKRIPSNFLISTLSLLQKLSHNEGYCILSRAVFELVFIVAAIVFLHSICSSSFSVLLYFSNIFCWLKFGLLFTRPAVFYLGPGPRDRKHVKGVRHVCAKF